MCKCSENRKRAVEFWYKKGELITGYFHQWGVKSKESILGTNQRTIGICEDLDGHVYEISPENIKFTQ